MGGGLSGAFSLHRLGCFYPSVWGFALQVSPSYNGGVPRKWHWGALFSDFDIRSAP